MERHAGVLAESIRLTTGTARIADARPLVVRFGAMGDMVLVMTLIDALHRRFGKPVDLLSSGGWLRDLVGSQPGVGRLYLVPSRRRAYWLSPGQWRLATELRAEGLPLTWVGDGKAHARRLVRHLGIPDDCVVDIADCPLHAGEHLVDRWLRFAALAPPALMSPETTVTTAHVHSAPRLVVQPAWREELERWLESRSLAGQRILLIQAGNKRTMRWWARRQRASNTKYWPETHWARVIDGMLEREPDARVLTLGVPAEAALNDDILRLVSRSGALNVAQDLPMSRLLALQEQAGGMISVDTGPAHSAAALGCPLVVLFGAADPRQIGPRSAGSPVEILGGPGAGGVGSVTPAAVLEAWDRICAAQSAVAATR